MRCGRPIRTRSWIILLAALILKSLLDRIHSAGAGLESFDLALRRLILSLGLSNLDVGAATTGLMVAPPRIIVRGSTICCSLHKAKVRASILAWSVALPPVHAIDVNFVGERVIHADARA